MSVLGYHIFPDSTPYANQMHIELSKKGDDYVKKVISKREDLPNEAKAILSEDPNETVRSNLKAS